MFEVAQYCIHLIEIKKVTDLVRTEVMEILKAKLKNISVHYLTIDYANGHENPCQLVAYHYLYLNVRFQ